MAEGHAAAQVGLRGRRAHAARLPAASAALTLSAMLSASSAAPSRALSCSSASSRCSWRWASASWLPCRSAACVGGRREEGRTCVGSHDGAWLVARAHLPPLPQAHLAPVVGFLPRARQLLLQVLDGGLQGVGAGAGERRLAVGAAEGGLLARQLNARPCCSRLGLEQQRGALLQLRVLLLQHRLRRAGDGRERWGGWRAVGGGDRGRHWQAGQPAFPRTWASMAAARGSGAALRAAHNRRSRAWRAGLRSACRFPGE